MNKKDVIELFHHVKKKRLRENNSNMFTKTKKSGCSTCGKVTWKPNR